MPIDRNICTHRHIEIDGSCSDCGTTWRERARIREEKERRMTSDRDTLADLIYRVGCYDNEDAAAAAADRLIAAGVRPPARVIETAEELEALPSGSVVVHTPCPDDHGCLWQSGTGGWWFTPDDGCPYEPHDLISHCGISGRLLLLWEPEREAQ